MGELLGKGLDGWLIAELGPQKGGQDEAAAQPQALFIAPFKDFLADFGLE